MRFPPMNRTMSQARVFLAVPSFSDRCDDDSAEGDAERVNGHEVAGDRDADVEVGCDFGKEPEDNSVSLAANPPAARAINRSIASSSLRLVGTRPAKAYVP